MQQVNVFIETSSRFRGNVERKCGYVLSTQLRTGKETREHFGRVTGTYHAADKKEIWDFQEKTKDGTVTEFTAQFSVKRTGGGVNGVIEFEVTMAVQSEIKQTDPA